MPAPPIDTATLVLLAVPAQLAALALGALAYVAIWRAAYPDGPRPTATRIATIALIGTAVNTLLPLGLGTATMLALFLVIIPGARPAGVAAGVGVHKALPGAIGLAIGAYAAAGLALPMLADVPRVALVVPVLLLIAVAVLVRRRAVDLRRMTDEARTGCAILRRPIAYAAFVAVPQLVAVAAKLVTLALFLAAFRLPVSADSVLTASAAGMAASAWAITPNGLGANQGAVAAALHDLADPGRLAAFSLAHQLTMGVCTLLLAAACTALFLGGRDGIGLVARTVQSNRPRRRTA